MGRPPPLREAGDFAARAPGFGDYQRRHQETWLSCVSR